VHCFDIASACKTPVKKRLNITNFMIMLFCAERKAAIIPINRNALICKFLPALHLNT